jgi:hypothetical protein
MAKKHPDRPGDSILVAVGRYPSGVSLGELHRELKKFSRRTLGRRLAEFVSEGKLRREGAARAARYFTVSASAAGRLHAEEETYVPLSEPGRAIRDFIRRPAEARRPVGYQREFLDDYVPNRTSYLAENVRRHLHHIGRSPVGSEHPAGTYARHILSRLLIDLSWASSRLEGNTYSRLDTERLIQFGQAVEGKDATETQMILNHKAAIEFLVDQAEELRFNRYTILNLHALLSENLLSNQEAAGRLRRIPVEITGSVFHPLAIPQVLEECFDQILDTASAIRDPFEQSFFVMVHIPYLQPFEDVNKRVSRLAANVPLIQRNLCPLSFVDVPERAYTEGTLGVYELNRCDLLLDVFVWSYERSCQRYLAVRQSMAAPDPFRLRYREALIEAVSGAVRRLAVPPESVIRDYALELIPAEDRAAFVDMARNELERLHEGTIARYRLRPSELEAWKKGRTPT